MPKRFEVKRVRACRPGYPGRDQAVDIKRLLSGTLFRLFSPAAVAAAAVVGGIAAFATGGARAGEEEPLTKTQEQIDKDVADILESYLAPAREAEPPAGGEFEKSKIVEQRVLSANPPVSILEQDLEDGIGRIVLRGARLAAAPRLLPDTEKQALYKKIALDVFKAYEVDVAAETNLQLTGAETGEGEVEFIADGFDAAARVGFEIVAERQLEALCGGVPGDDSEPRAALLEEAEWAALDGAVKQGKVNMFVMYMKDNYLQFNPEDEVRCFVDSLVSYLNWLKAEGKL